MRSTGTLTALQFAALAMYAEKPRHPYDVFAEMVRRGEDQLVKLRPGTLYHAVKRLEQDGLLEEQGTDRDGNRPERTTYAITPAGRAAVTEHLVTMLATPAKEYPQFPLGLAEITLLTPAAAESVLQTRVTAMRAALTELRAVEPRLHAKALPEILWVEHQWLVATRTADLDFTERLLGRIRSGDLSWSPDPVGAAPVPETHRQGAPP